MHVFNLPPELLRDVLIRLDYRSLLAYSLTCRSNYIFASSCLTRLEIAIHPSQQAAVLVATKVLCSTESRPDDAPDGTNIILPTEQSKTHYLTIHRQNKIVSNILAKHHASLRSLDLSIWELEMKTATALSQASRLQHLTLRMDHPLARVKHMPFNFWNTSPGSTVWNTLYAAPKILFPPTPPHSPCSSRSSSPAPSFFPRAVFTELRTLHLERAGITDYQIQRIISENTNLTEIRLRKCLTLTDEFFRDLSDSEICYQARGKKKGLKLLHFEMSTNPTIDHRILKYIGQMTSLEVRSPACKKENSHKLITPKTVSQLQRLHKSVQRTHPAPERHRMEDPQSGPTPVR